MKRIIPTYRRLYREKKIDISFTPYYHPILPLLIDTDSAREAIPDINLPQNRFQFPDDARWHIKKSSEKFQSLFGRPLEGMWPSEGSVSEKALEIIDQEGIGWIATDENILRQSLLKSGQSTAECSVHRPYYFNKFPNLKIFFRDHGLSDKIGFVYSGWETGRAVDDFMSSLKSIHGLLKDKSDQCLVPIILDGENAWEYFPNDAGDFLTGIYTSLEKDNKIETVFFTEAAALQAGKLKRVSAGSWINHNFRIWIGHNEDNAAWDMLYEARRAMEKYEKDNPDADKKTIEAARHQLYIAEGSDWCWWYGDEHIGAHNSEFDKLFRQHLSIFYRLLNLDIPESVFKPIHKGRMDTYVSNPESIITPRLDGLLTHYYEWSGAGYYDCNKAGGAMHRVKIFIKIIYFAFDYDNVYIRLDFGDSFDLVARGKIKIRLEFDNSGTWEFEPVADIAEAGEGVKYGWKRLLEIGVPRKVICENGIGTARFFIKLFSGDDLLEKWPLDEPIDLVLPEKDKEIFWQL
jgi:alpha-amylase/alpha-mannosidase (GH57 family)